MGIGITQFKFIEKCINECSDNPHTMLELGNQRLKRGLDKKLGFKTAKCYYESVGFEHVSFDLNGKDGAIPFDLSNIIKDTKYYNYFDVITNSGTSEHVEPFKRQYECFKNIHLCMKKNSLAIHIVPEYKTWLKHSNIYYRKIFWETLIELNKYKMIFLETITKEDKKKFLACCYRKENDLPFTNDRDLILKNIFYKKGNRRSSYSKIK